MFSQWKKIYISLFLLVFLKLSLEFKWSLQLYVTHFLDFDHINIILDYSSPPFSKNQYLVFSAF